MKSKKEKLKKKSVFTPEVMSNKLLEVDVETSYLERIKKDALKKRGTIRDDVQRITGDILKPSWRYPIHRIKYRWRKWRYKKDFIFIKMELDAGGVQQGRVDLEGEEFYFNGLPYIIEDKYKYYDFTLGGFCLDYHEGFSLPIQRRFPLNAIRRAFKEDKDGYIIEYAVNPVTLGTYLEGNVIEQMIRGASGEDNGIGPMKMMLYILIGITGLILLLTLRKARGGA